MHLCYSTMHFSALMEWTNFFCIISSLPASYHHCGSDYLGFDVSLICHGLGLGLAVSGLGLDLELCGLVNITAVAIYQQSFTFHTMDQN